MYVHPKPLTSATAPLHQIDRELARCLAEGGSPLDLRDPSEARRVSRERATARNASWPEHAVVEIAEHSIIGNSGQEIRMRTYRPAGGRELLPVVVHFHGGAFIVGDLDTEDRECCETSHRAGCLMVSVDYRLAPEHPFPAAVEDAYAALQWVEANASALGVDTGRLAVSGTSAGGCIAAAVAMMARDRGGPRLRLQCLMYPALDDRMSTASSRWTDAPVLAHEQLEVMWLQYVGTPGDEISPYAAPARQRDLAGLPATYMVVAGVDPLRDEALHHATRLTDAGVAVELHLFPGAVHGFDRLGDTAMGRRSTTDRNVALGNALHSEPLTTIWPDE
jgi:acetyl esterase